MHFATSPLLKKSAKLLIAIRTPFDYLVVSLVVGTPNNWNCCPNLDMVDTLLNNLNCSSLHADIPSCHLLLISIHVHAIIYAVCDLSSSKKSANC